MIKISLKFANGLFQKPLKLEYLIYWLQTYGDQQTNECVIGALFTKMFWY